MTAIKSTALSPIIQTAVNHVLPRLINHILSVSRSKERGATLRIFEKDLNQRRTSASNSASLAILLSSIRYSLDVASTSKVKQAVCLFEYLLRNPKICKTLTSVYNQTTPINGEDKVEAMRLLGVLKLALKVEGIALLHASTHRQPKSSIELQELQEVVLSKTERALAKGGAAITKFLRLMCDISS